MALLSVLVLLPVLLALLAVTALLPVLALSIATHRRLHSSRRLADEDGSCGTPRVQADFVAVAQCDRLTVL